MICCLECPASSPSARYLVLDARLSMRELDCSTHETWVVSSDVGL